MSESEAEAALAVRVLTFQSTAESVHSGHDQHAALNIYGIIQKTPVH